MNRIKVNTVSWVIIIIVITMCIARAVAKTSTRVNQEKAPVKRFYNILYFFFSDPPISPTRVDVRFRPIIVIFMKRARVSSSVSHGDFYQRAIQSRACRFSLEPSSDLHDYFSFFFIRRSLWSVTTEIDIKARVTSQYLYIYRTVYTRRRVLFLLSAVYPKLPTRVN